MFFNFNKMRPFVIASTLFLGTSVIASPAAFAASYDTSNISLKTNNVCEVENTYNFNLDVNDFDFNTWALNLRVQSPAGDRWSFFGTLRPGDPWGGAPGAANGEFKTTPCELGRIMRSTSLFEYDLKPGPEESTIIFKDEKLNSLLSVKFTSRGNFKKTKGSSAGNWNLFPA